MLAGPFGEISMIECCYLYNEDLNAGGIYVKGLRDHWYSWKGDQNSYV